MVVKEKKWAQVRIDKDLVDDTETVLSELGLDPTATINMFCGRIVANGALPFNASLSEKERADLRFLKVTEGTPVTEFKDAKEAADWLSDSDGDQWLSRSIR